VTAVLIATAAVLLTASPASAENPVLDAEGDADLAAALAEATEVQGVCYGYDLSVEDGDTGQWADTKNAPFKIKQEVLPWKGILAGVASGRYAATNAAASILEERAKAVDFTMPTAMLTNFYLKRKDDDSIKSINDFAGKKIGVQQGGATAALIDTAVQPELNKSGGKLGNVAQYGAFAEAYQDLTNKRIDVVLNNIVALSQLVKEKPDLYEIGEQVGPEIFAGWAVKKGNKEMLEFFNTELGKLKKSGEMQKLQQKWLNVTFDNLPNQPKLPGGAPVPS